jgi:hypothetical protein
MSIAGKRTCRFYLDNLTCVNDWNLVDDKIIKKIQLATVHSSRVADVEPSAKNIRARIGYLMLVLMRINQEAEKGLLQKYIND